MLRQIVQKHPRLLPAAVVAGLLLFLSACSLATNSQLVDESYDWSQAALRPVDLSNTPVAIVYLDFDSYLREKQNPAHPWDRSLHAQLLKRLTAAGARAVVFDIIFDAPGEDAIADQEFIQAIRANGHVVLAGEIGQGSQNTGQTAGYQLLRLSKPGEMFLAAAATWGLANVRLDDDFVVRRQFESLPGFAEPSLSFAAANLLGLALTNSIKENWLRYYGKPLALPHVSYSAALRPEEVSDDFFRDKVIFIGARPMTGTILERKDEFRSPLASWGDPNLFMPAVEVHATQFLNLIRRDSLSRLPPAAEFIVLSLSAVICAWLLFSFRPLPAGGIALLIAAAVFVVAPGTLGRVHIWFPWLIICALQVPGALTGSVLFQSLEWYRQKKRFDTQRRADEAKIHEQAALIEKAQDAIYVEDLAGNILYSNPSADKLYGWSGGHKRFCHFDKIQLAEARQTALIRGEWSGKIDQTSNSGSKIIVNSRCTLIRDSGGQLASLLFINTDITEKTKLELEFFRAQRIESIGQIAGGIAHDLNNALSPVLMGLQMLRRQSADEDTLRMLDVMEDNTHRSADMVRQVLMFSRGRDAEKEPLAPAILLREIERIVHQTFPRNINVATLAPADLWTVMGNATQLHQVLLNLCVNARDAMPSGGELTLAADNVQLDADEAARMTGARPGRFVMLLVSDTGTGIAPEILPRVFEPFFSTKPAGQGTGLGLATTARIIAQHGGFVELKSEIDHGTLFEIYLPAVTISPAIGVSPSASTAFPRGSGELILVVDDEQSVCEMISLALTTQEYRVVTASNGAEAITLARQRADDIKLVLLDDDMPVMGGQTAWPQLRACLPGREIIFMSGKERETSVDENIGLRRLHKPFRLEDLMAVMARCLA
ncbi:MAG TPA: CHASE2 domain-containing protein [Verrucomicrobiae bacterium]|nr:CHASE2 domain-containing protein [Verrucomicrobiae bacterium]